MQGYIAVMKLRIEIIRINSSSGRIMLRRGNKAAQVRLSIAAVMI
jgi:hypothetical protein